MHAFGLLGIEGHVYKEGMEIGDMDADFFIVCEKAAEKLRDRLKAVEKRGKIVVEIPDKSGSIREKDPIASLVKRSVGVDMR